MIQVEGVDIEYPQIGREPQMGYTPEYIEKRMISGYIRRLYRGKRFNATFSYAFLTQEQIDEIRQLLDLQYQKGVLQIIISSPFGNYEGDAILELNGTQTRYKRDPDTGEFVWTNWRINVQGARYVDDN